MKDNISRPIVVPTEKKKAFTALTCIPNYSWPALILSLISICAVIIIDILALQGILTFPLALILLSLAYFYFFSVIHDSIHRSLCKNKKLNDFIGQLGSLIFSPNASLGLFRWAHMEHHRFTNDDGDPDIWCHGTWLSMPLRWMTIDFYYIYRLFINKTPQAKKVKKEFMPYFVIGSILIFTIIGLGYGFEYLVLCFLPVRAAFVLIGFSFFWLPHAHWPDDKHDLRQSKNYTLATTVRLGKEWLLNPILQYQNYHLIHHLWPTTPFYNNQKVWILLENELNERDLAIAKDFQIVADLKYAAKDTNG